MRFSISSHSSNRWRTIAIVAFLICATLLSVAAGRPLSSQVRKSDRELQRRIHISELDNGVQVVLAPASGSNLTTVNVWVRAGSAQDPPDRLGLAHYYEHMVFTGSDQFPGAASDWIESRGGYVNASTYYDHTEYYTVIPSEHSRIAIELLADMVTRRTFTRKDMENERNAVMREKERQEDDPSVRLLVDARQALLGANPYAMPVLGTEASIASITGEDLARWAERFYVPGNIVVVVVSDVEQGRLQEQIEASFGTIKPAPVPSWSRPEIDAPGSQLQHTVEYSGDRERVAVAWPMPAAAGLEEVAIRQVLAHLMSILLAHEDAETVVEYDVSLSPSLILVELAFPENIDSSDVLDEVLADLQGVLKGHVYREDVAWVKDWLIEDYRAERNLGVRFADQLGRFAVLTDDPLDAFAYVDAVERVDKRQLLAMARKHLAIDKRLEYRLVAIEDGDVGVVPVEAHASSQQGSLELRSVIGEDLRYALTEFGRHVSTRFVHFASWIRSRHWTVPLSEADMVDGTGYWTLDNGIRALLLPESGTDLVEVHVLVGKGVGVEAANEAGLSSFTGGLLMHSLGYGHFEGLHSSTDVYSLFDATQLSLLTTSTTWPAALPHFLDHILNPQWSWPSIDSYREEVFGYIRSRDEIPSTVARLQLRSALYGTGGYGNPRTGTMASVSCFTVDELKSFYRQFYVPDNVVVAVAGNFDPKMMVATLSRGLKDFGVSVGEGDPEHADPSPNLPTGLFWGLVEIQYDEQEGNLDHVMLNEGCDQQADRLAPKAVATTISTEMDEIQLAWVMIGLLGPEITSGDYPALRVLNSVMGGGSSSRLYSHFRGQEGDVYIAYSFVRGLQRGSFMNLYAQISPDDRVKFVKDSLIEFRSIAEDGLSEEELQVAIAREVGLQLRQREWLGDRAILKGLDMLLGAEYQEADPLSQRIKNVSVDDVRAAAAQVLEHYVVSEVVPKEQTPSSSDR